MTDAATIYRHLHKFVMFLMEREILKKTCTHSNYAMTDYGSFGTTDLKSTYTACTRWVFGTALCFEKQVVKMKSSVLYLMISLSGMVFGAEIVASHITQSLVLLISAYHMLYNILSLLLLVISHRMSKGKTLKNTFGWARVKVLGLLVNMLFLAACCFAAAVEAMQTMVHASHENTEPRYPMLLIVLGIINLSLNVLCFLLIGGYTHHQGCSMIIQGDVQMNCVLADTVENKNACTSNGSSRIWDKAPRWCGDHQILDVSRDVSSCLTVIACGSVILLMDGLILKYADAILAIVSLTVLLCTTYPFVRESGLILLQSIPSHIDVNGLTKRLVAEFPDVLNVHDLHVWRLTTSVVIATVHIILSTPEVYPRLEPRLKDFFLTEGISSTTIQPEFSNGSKTTECILQCSVNNNCGALTCCGPILHKAKQDLRLRNGHSHNTCLGHFEYTAVEKPPVSDLPQLPQYDFAKIATALETTL